jgi:hypothetical protein
MARSVIAMQIKKDQTFHENANEVKAENVALAASTP